MSLSSTDHQAHLDHAEEKTVFGFWVYLMTDCVLFASLFATYAVLRNNVYGGSTGSTLFDLPMVLVETMILLASSFTCGLAYYWARRGNVNQAVIWNVITFLLGALFLAIEFREFHTLVAEGNSWQRSGFLTSFFTLVGTHGAHILVGLIWLAVMIRQIMSKGLTRHVMRRLTLFGMYWHFLDLVWIFIFTIVYLMGVIKL